jgi:hypothetical protein
VTERALRTQERISVDVMPSALAIAGQNYKKSKYEQIMHIVGNITFVRRETRLLSDAA